MKEGVVIFVDYVPADPAKPRNIIERLIGQTPGKPTKGDAHGTA